MARKKLIWGALALGLYGLLLWLLVAAESAYVPAAGDTTKIASLPLAIWYSLTTLTTVGYGDVYPHTLAGRFIGGVFQVFSLGLFVFLMGLLLTQLREQLLPRLWLRARRKKPWAIFSGTPADAEAMAAGYAEAHPEALLLFSGAKGPGRPRGNRMETSFAPAELLALHDGGPTVFFALGADGFENLRAAEDLAARGADAYALSAYEPETLPAGVTAFHPDRCRARLYWAEHPLVKTEETVALIGGGPGAQALLEQALLVNCFSSRQHIVYRLYGDFSAFFAQRPYLSSVFSLDAAASDRDSLLRLPGSWSADFEAVRRADRIIVMEETEERTLATLGELLRFCPAQGQIHAWAEEPMAGALCFGGRREIFTPELVMRIGLDRAAKAMHELYLQQTGQAGPAWAELSRFSRDSNRASADHLPVKRRLLLGGDGHATNEAAARVFAQAASEQRERFRQIEHERWMRFHVLNNWQYGPQRDNARRLHPCLVPYGQLSEADRRKDDLAWEMLGMLQEG